MSFSQLQTGHLRDGVLAGSTLQRAIQFDESLSHPDNKSLFRVEHLLAGLSQRSSIGSRVKIKTFREY